MAGDCVLTARPQFAKTQDPHVGERGGREFVPALL